MDNNELLNLACLRAVWEVARAGSVSRAAAALFRAQSAVTRAVQETEAALGALMFDRKPTGMLPTPVGRTVLERSERIFDELGELARWCAAQQSRRRAVGGGVPAYLLHTRRLQVFSILARHRHMPSTARALGITQPAVSSAIRILENGAGLPLFYRNPRGLMLTGEGETFLLHVRRALNELRHVVDDVYAWRGSSQGGGTGVALPLGRTLILPKAVAQVTGRYPGMRVVTDESAYEPLVAGLRAGDIDFVLGALRNNDAASGLENEKLLSEDLAILARRGHALADVRGLTLKDLTHAQWILPRAHSPARSLFEALFKRMKLEPPMPTVETADLAMIRGLLFNSDMIAVLSAHQLHYERASGELAALDVPMPKTRRDIGLTLRAGSTPSPAARVLIDAIRQAAGKVAGIK